MSETKKWLAAYLYCPEPWDKFLVEAVHPFVDVVLKEKLAEQFFFIRYWERGPHIRLRFKGEADILDETLKPKLVSYFGDYFAKNNSVRTEPDWVKSLPENQQWFPNNSIQFIEYEPEIKRYGGPIGMAISEKQFEISSRCVLAVLRECKSWDYDRALGAAIQLHLSFAFAMGMTLHETVQFFSFVSKGWLISAMGYTQNMSAEVLQQSKEIVLNAFEENFDKQKSTLVSFHHTLWNALRNECEFEQKWLNSWLDETLEIAKAIKQAQVSQELIFGKAPYKDLNTAIPGIAVTLSSILESYVHMTNNRLGIMNRDEAYLGYLITHSLLALDEKSGEPGKVTTTRSSHG